MIGIVHKLHQVGFEPAVTDAAVFAGDRDSERRYLRAQGLGACITLSNGPRVAPATDFMTFVPRTLQAIDQTELGVAFPTSSMQTWQALIENSLLRRLSRKF